MSDVNPVNPVAMTVFIAFFVLVTVIGFFAARWKRGDMTQLHSSWAGTSIPPIP
jgi:SSS family solute:Na+ symporter